MRTSIILMLLIGAWQASLCQKTAIHLLAIGNETYLSNSGFISHVGPVQSARNFAKCFGGVATTRLLLSEKGRPLSKEQMITEIDSFITFVGAAGPDGVIGLIYYCGHGIADVSGTAYFVPGKLDKSVDEETFPALQEKLLNIDKIRQLVITSQQSRPGTRFVILADCCSDQSSARMYSWLKFSFAGDSLGSIDYNVDSMRAHPEVKFDLQRSAELTFDAPVGRKEDTTAPRQVAAGELSFLIPEMIRKHTFEKSNTFVYSCPLGKVTPLVTDPFSPSQKIGPICRRTLLYFRNKRFSGIDDYITKMADIGFDRYTKPSVINRSRNSE